MSIMKVGINPPLPDGPVYVWIVMKVFSEVGNEDYVQGVFANRDDAIEACINNRHCMSKFLLGEELLQETVREEDWEFPNLEYEE
jgi:hypothetical protein